MNTKSVNILEYNKIIEKLSLQAVSGPGKRFIEKIGPLYDEAEIRERLLETSEAASLIIHKGPLPLGSFHDIARDVHYARKGGTLTMGQLLHISYNLKIASDVVRFLKSDVPEIPAIKSIAEVIEPVETLRSEVERCIVSEDEMADNASGELRSLRRAIIRQNETLKARLNQMITSSDNRTVLQDAIVTVRDGRYVIPVKQEHRARVPGIVHDRSSTGATLFIEPQVAVNLNNELRELELKEKAEINRILGELSGIVSEHFHEILNNQKLLLKLDFIMAKGKLSVSMGAEEPKISGPGGGIVLKEARHPLIDRKTAVPVSVSIGEKYNTLVITGPNTGGKTVTLKTLGLLIMMAQTGLHIPASSESRISVVREIYADIGDEQSIEQSLSTFSSHMKNIVEIVEKADDESLVLLDELGAGTDPTEGAALAISILERLYSKGVKTAATTHYTELKKYAISTPGVENASMEFDVETLSPTYRLVTGMPGKSNAFEISEKLGLQEEIVERARTLLKKEDIRFEEVITALESDRKAAEEERDEAAMLRAEIKEQKEAIELREKKLAEREEKIIADAREKAREIIRDANDTVKEVQDELKELSKIESLGERNRKFDENRKRLRDTAGKYREKIVREVNDNPVAPEDLKIGDRVKLLTLNQNGEIVSLPDSRGNIQVQIGSLKVSSNVNEIMLIEGGAFGTNKQKKIKNYGSMYRAKAQTISSSVDVRGMNLDDALMETEKYLDDAFMAGLEKVTVIHGRGEGILKNGIRDMLKKNSHVKKFETGGYRDGGDGVTNVEMKK